ncbi:hypothetical protein MMC21_001437 [Puttea exsequens]|nr:hypothetical protein [Puttea exsequens]
MTMAPRNSRDYDEESRASPSAEQTHPLKPHQPVPTLPLPPLNRLSAFEIDLPGTVPSYPSTPHLGYQSSPPNPSTQSSLSVASPLGQIVPKTRAHRFSSAPSEPGSTLVGSDNDNSRLLSGDEDETDARSETIYDSTRTGATGSSHSGLRRLPIDTIFDESAPPSIPLKSKIVALEDLLHRDTFDERDLIEHHNVVEEQDVSTPVRPTQPSKEEGSPTPMHDDSEVFPSPITSSSPTPPPPELKSTSQLTSGLDLDQDDDLWSFEDPNYKPTISKDFNEPAPEEEPRSLVAPARKPKEELFRRRESPNSSPVDQVPRSNLFEWSEHPSADKDNLRGESPRPRTVHGRQGSEMRGSRIRGYRGPSAIHLRSQSVPVPDMAGHRTHNDPSKIDAWVLGNKPASEDWDGDFEFEEASNDTPKQARASGEDIKSSGMIVPRAILERQASVHGQFGQVKELTLLVEELKRLQQQAAGLGIMDGQSSELWKEADGIINLATLDEEEQDRFPSRTPQSPSFDFDSFDEDSPSSRPQRKSGVSQQRDERLRLTDDSSESQNSSRPSQDLSGLETPPSTRPRKESSAKAKSVLETIYQQRNHNDSLLLDVPYAQKKLPFDTTSLKDLVTRAGVVTRALKEIVRRADSSPDTPETLPPTPPREPPFISKMFQQPPASPTPNKPPRATNSPKSPRSPKRQRSSNFLSGNIAGNDNEINGHMKMMTVV